MATWNTDNPKVGNTIAADIPDIEENLQELHDVVEAITNGTLGTTTAADFKVDASSYVKTMFIPAGDFAPTTTNGSAAVADAELAGQDIQVEYLAFDDGTEEFACCTKPMPEDYDLGTIRAKFFWYGAAGCSAADTVEWEIAAGSVTDDVALDTALGTGVAISDAITVDGDLQLTATTAAITIGSTPVSGDLIVFKVSRNVGGTDDMTEDAHLLGVWIQYTADVKATAWS
jgi:hypothetical protein